MREGPDLVSRAEFERRGEFGRLAHRPIVPFGPSQDLGTKCTSPLPKSKPDFKKWQFRESLGDLRTDTWIAQQLCKNGRSYENLPVIERPCE